MDWETYITDQMNAAYETCCGHRQSLNLPIDDILSLECEMEPCNETCPFNPANRNHS